MGAQTATGLKVPGDYNSRGSIRGDFSGAFLDGGRFFSDAFVAFAKGNTNHEEPK
jgi:hypothetical protein